MAGVRYSGREMPTLTVEGFGRVDVEHGKRLVLAIESETGGGQSGIDVHWSVRHARAARPLDEQTLSIGNGWLA